MAKILTTIQGSGQSAQLGATFANPLVVRVTDGGNPVAGEGVVFSVPLTAGAPSGRFGGATTLTTNTDANGYATATPTAEVAVGAWTGLTQLTAALSTTCNWNLTNLAVAPASVTITTGTNLKAALNAAYGTLRATVKDSGGSGLSGITVQFSVPAGHGTFAGGLTTVTAVTAAGGAADAPTFTANATPGSFTVTVTVPVAPALSATTTWENVDATIPTTVQAYNGGGQQTAISTSFAGPLQARVTNGLGSPLAGVNVTFTSPGAGASCTFPALVTTFATYGGVTDVNGIATSTTPIANAFTGTYYVTATVAGATGAQFQLTNGVSYQPEVCTTNSNPASAVGALGTGSDSWVNPTNAINGNTNGSIVDNSASNGSSKLLLCSPWGAEVNAAIADGAKITKITVLWSQKAVIISPGTNTPRCGLGIYNSAGSGVVAPLTFTNTVVNSFEAFSQLFNIPATVTGAQLKAGIGPGFRLNSTSPRQGSLSVRQVKCNICYQNPDTPASATLSVPLQLCEA